MLKLIPEVKQIIYHHSDSFCFQDDFDIQLVMESEDLRINKLVEKQFSKAQIYQQKSKLFNGFMMTCNFSGHFKLDVEVQNKLQDQQEGYFIRIESESAVIYAPFVRGLFYGIHTFIQLIENHDSIPSLKIIDWPNIALRSMNYDFRVLFSKHEKLLEYMEQFAGFKANTILIEYEDKFPFKKHKHLVHEDYSFTEEQFIELKEAAYQNFIEIIPLQQTFGHLEYVLKHERYEHLRETDQAIGELCPSDNDSYLLATELLEEIIDAHPDSQYIHLGCDEVYSLCSCHQCIKLNEGSREKTFIRYVNKLVDYVIRKGKVPIIWHDMMVKCSEEDIKLLDQRVIVMIWIYDGKNIESRVTGFMNLFRKYGVEVWGGPSVRCFDQTDDQNYPIAEKRIANVTQWVNTANKLRINGMVTTNWGTVFGMGVPYGIFETSWYLIGYSLDKYWSFEADNSSYMERFLQVFHGVNIEDIQELLLDYFDLEDYYVIIEKILDRVEKNKEAAEMISIMKEFEVPAGKSRTIHKYIYRWMLYEATEAEKISLRLKYQKTTEALNRIRPRMENQLRVFLPEGMVQHYMHSRFYLFDFLEKNLYQNSGLLD
jgi:hexosaminidase